MADTALMDMTETTAILGDENFYLLDDPSGTPVDRRATIDTLADYIDWRPIVATWTRTGDHTFTITGDVTATYSPGVKVRYKDGGAFEYGVIGTSSYSAPNTTVTLITTSDYAMAAAPITEPSISRVYTPKGFPDWFNWLPTIGGFGGGSEPVNGIYRWRTSGRLIALDVRQPTAGTSGANTLTLTAPIVAKTITNMIWGGWATVTDNGTVQTAAGAVLIASGSSSITFSVNAAGAGGWTASGDKRINVGGIEYEFG